MGQGWGQGTLRSTLGSGLSLVNLWGRGNRIVDTHLGRIKCEASSCVPRSLTRTMHVHPNAKFLHGTFLFSHSSRMCLGSSRMAMMAPHPGHSTATRRARLLEAAASIAARRLDSTRRSWAARSASIASVTAYQWWSGCRFVGMLGYRWLASSHCMRRAHDGEPAVTT